MGNSLLNLIIKKGTPLLFKNARSEKQVLEEIKKLSRQRITDVKVDKWKPWQSAERQKQMIRDARAAQSAGAKAELAWMQAHPDKATKVYAKTGTREFGGAENKAALEAARKEAMKDYIKQFQGRKLRTGWKVVGGAGAAVAIPIYNFLNNKVQDNMLPFGYYDQRRSNPLDPQNSTKDYIEAAARGVLKFVPAAYGFKSDARKKFDLIANADLSDQK